MQNMREPIPLILFIETGHQDLPCVVADPGWQNQQNETNVTWLDQSEG